MKYRLLLFLIICLSIIPVRAQDATSTPLPSLEPITTLNAGRVEQLGILGYGLIFDTAWAPDGKTVAVASSTGLTLYDSEQFDRVVYRHLSVSEDFTVAVAFSPDGNWLASFSRGTYFSTSNKATARLWNVRDGSIVVQWELEIDGVFDYKAAFSPDSNTLSLYSYNQARLWDIHNQQHVVQLPEKSWSAVQREWYAPDTPQAINQHDQNIAAYSLDEKLAAVLDEGGIIHLWSLTDEQEIEQIPAYANAIAINPTGTLLVWQVFGEGWVELHIWDVAKNEEVLNQNYPITSIAFNPAGDKLVIATSSSNVYVRDFRNHTERIVLGNDSDYYSENVYSVAFAPDGLTLAVIRTNYLELWDTVTSTKLAAVSASDNGYLKRVTFSPDGSIIATAGADNYVRLWDAKTLKQRASVFHIGDSLDVAFSPDGKLVATYASASSENRDPTIVYLWNLDDILKGKTIQTDQALAAIYHFNLVGRIYSARFSPDGKKIAITGMGIEIWDVAKVLQAKLVGDGVSSGDLVGDFTDNLAQVIEAGAGPLEWNPDGSQLASGLNGTDCDLAVWDVVQLTQVACISGIEGNTTSLIFNPQGDVLASSSSGANDDDEEANIVYLWDIQSGKQLIGLNKHYEDVRTVAFSPDGKWLASGSGGCYLCGGEGLGIDGVVRLWGVPK